MNDFTNAKSHARETSACNVRFGGPITEWPLLLLWSLESIAVTGGQF